LNERARFLLDTNFALFLIVGLARDIYAAPTTTRRVIVKRTSRQPA
jgi:hypothetical protein